MEIREVREPLVHIGLIFLQLSLVAVGGGNSILPDIHRQVVESRHWMTSQEFVALSALAQASPGPNLMIVPLVGWHVAKLPGLLVASIAMFGPTSLMTAFVMRTWDRFRDRHWRKTVQSGVAPVTAGLVLASAIVITQAAAPTPTLAVIAALSATTLALSRMPPLLLLMTGAVINLFFN